MNIRALEAWYLKHQRVLPFRETDDPYKIWVSEIMLQQTQVETVLPYYMSFIKKYPNISALAETDQQTLLKEVEGLGYYRRFINMHEAAVQIQEDMDGQFPDSFEGVKSLKGVGQYTTGAIMSIAYNKPYAATDGNVIRVLSRIHAIKDDLRLDKHRRKVHEINQSMIEKGHPRIYTQALMELGALICRPTKPLCSKCPLKSDCLAFLEGRQETLPYISKKSPQKTSEWITLILKKNDCIFLRKRQERLLHGMYEYPQYNIKNVDDVCHQLAQQGIYIDQPRYLASYRHVFTHRIWEMQVYEAKVLSGQATDWELFSQEDSHHVPMAIAHRQIVI